MNVASSVEVGSRATLLRFSGELVRQEGLLGGLVRPALGTQVVLAFVTMGTKWGCYPMVRDSLSAFHGKEKSANTMFLAGFLSGAMAYAITTPLYGIKNRLIGDAGLVVDGKLVTGARAGQPKHYRNLVHAGGKIAASEGVGGLWRGVAPMVVRGSLLNAGHTMGYDYTKTFCQQRGWLEDGPPLHVLASVNAALLMCTLSCPADVVATRYQSGPLLGHRFTSPAHCAMAIVREEGLQAFYQGWTPFFLRHAPLLCVLMPLYEQFRYALGLGYMA